MGRFLVLVIFAGLLGLGIWFGAVKPQLDGKNNQKASQIQTTVSGARTQSGSDAVQSVQAEANREKSTDAQVEEATHDIQNAPGAKTPVSPELNCAGLRALCMREQYRDSDRCRRVLKSCPKGVE